MNIRKNIIKNIIGYTNVASMICAPLLCLSRCFNCCLNLPTVLPLSHHGTGDAVSRTNNYSLKCLLVMLYDYGFTQGMSFSAAKAAA